MKTWDVTGSGIADIDLSSVVPISSGSTTGFQELIVPGSDELLEQTIDVQVSLQSE